jgi:beta-lactamase class C
MHVHSQHTHPMPATKVMPTFLHTAVFALLSLPMAAGAVAQTTAPSREPSFMGDARAMDAMAQQVVERTRIPGLAMVIVQDGKILVMRGYGVTDARGTEPVTADTVFRLASLSKAFAGTLAALLVQDGSLRWDMRIADHLPAFKLANLQDTQSLTVRDILSQRAGLTHNTYDRDLESDVPFELLVQKLADAPLACAPGDCYAYQNVSFSLIADIVFAATGDFYTHQVEKRIFQPLGMYNSSYGRDALEASPSWARPHVRGGGGWMPIRPKEAYYRIPPAAGVNVSIHDMAQWLIAQMGHRPDVLSAEVLADVHTQQVPTPDQLHGSPWRRERVSNAFYATGWRIFNYAGHTLVFHGGAVQGYRSEIAFLPDHDIGAVLLWNSESAVPSGLMPTILDRALGLPERDWIELDQATRVAAMSHHRGKSASKSHRSGKPGKSKAVRKSGKHRTR